MAGRVRLSAVPILTNRLIAPRLRPFVTRHPDLELELVAEPANLSLMAREVDLALRLARPQAEARALTRRLGRLDYGLFAAREAPLRTAGWIAFEEKTRVLPQNTWIAERRALGDAAAVVLRVNDTETLLQAVKAGLGKAYLPLFAAAAEPDLVRLDEGSRARSRELWLLRHPQTKDLARIRGVADWLAALLEELSSSARV